MPQTIQPNSVAIVGAAGHIGMPLSVVLAEAGYDATGVDRNAAACEQLMRGEIPYIEHGAKELLDRGLARGNLRFTTDDAALATAETIVLIIGTPVDDNMNPRIDPLLDILQKHAPRMPRGQLIVLRSTVSPGTTELMKKILEDRTGWREGVDFSLVFAPERVLQTKAVEEIKTLPQLIGAFSDAGYEQARKFFERFLSNQCLRLTPVEAELGKLMTNMSRYISFAVANEFYMICDSYGANSHHVINACNKDYPRLSLPRPGSNVGGPCLYKDGYYLIDRIPFQEIISSAFKINECVTRYLLDKVKKQTTLRRAGIMGMAFKADCDDTRNSLSFKLQKQLRGIDCLPVPVDPFVEEYADYERLKGADALFLMTPHKEFRDLSKILKIVDNPACVICDMWNFWSENSNLSHDGIYTAAQASAA